MNDARLKLGNKMVEVPIDNLSRVLPDPRVIFILARRWFSGNTYHAVKVYVDGDLVGSVSYRYGGNSTYLQTAQEILVGAGIYSDDDRKPLHRLVYNAGDKMIHDVADVATKRDLIHW